MHAGYASAFPLGYKSRARKKIVKFGTAVSCDKNFAVSCPVSLRRCDKKVAVAHALSACSVNVGGQKLRGHVGNNDDDGGARSMGGEIKSRSGH